MAGKKMLWYHVIRPDYNLIIFYLGMNRYQMHIFDDELVEVHAI